MLGYRRKKECFLRHLFSLVCKVRENGKCTSKIILRESRRLQLFHLVCESDCKEPGPRFVGQGTVLNTFIRPTDIKTGKRK